MGQIESFHWPQVASIQLLAHPCFNLRFLPLLLKENNIWKAKTFYLRFKSCINILDCLLSATAQRVFQLKDNGRHLMGYEQSQKRAGYEVSNHFLQSSGSKKCMSRYPLIVTTQKTAI